MKRSHLIFLFLLFTQLSNAQQDKLNEYGLYVITDFNRYQESISIDSSKRLANLLEFIDNIRLDVKYATDDNFLGKSVYDTALAFLRFPTAQALKQVQSELITMGLGIKIFDAYRPYSVTVAFYKNYPDSTYVASPWKGSRHNRGCAVDLTIVSLDTGEEIEMPTAYDDFTDKAHHDYSDLLEEIIHNRELLKSLMEKYGFKSYPYEWWHYDFEGWENFELLDINFRQLTNE